VASEFLRVKNLNGALDLTVRLWLLNPVALPVFLVRPAYKVRRDGLGHATRGATFVLDVEVAPAE